MTYQIKEENVVIESIFKLSGTMTIPIDNESVFPAVLIMPGSGGADRDGNNGRFEMGIYKDLAEFLTGLGFVTLRYDKRGTHQSAGDPYRRGFHDTAADAAAALRFLKKHPNVDSQRTIIMGHSEGAQAAPAVYAQEKAAGMILLCGGAMGMQDIMIWQRQQAYDALDKLNGFKGWLIRSLKVTSKAKVKVAKFEQKIMNGTEETVKVAGKKFPAKWMREFYQYDVFGDLRHVTCPVLVIAGEKDTQVPPQAGESVASTVSGEAEFHIIKNMTHILKCWDGAMDAANPLKIYKQLLHVPLPDELTDCIDTWLDKHFIFEEANVE